MDDSNEPQELGALVDVNDDWFGLKRHSLLLGSPFIKKRRKAKNGTSGKP